MSSQELATFINILFTVIGFVVIFFKLGERVTRVETHVIHILRKLSMSPRDRNDTEDYKDA